MTIDLTIVIYTDDVVEDNEEYKILKAATSGNRIFNLMGNQYAVIEYIRQTFSQPQTWPQVRIKRNKIVINAMKINKVNLGE